jgi:hypothetical protein
MSRPYRSTKAADNESQECDKQPLCMFHCIAPYSREAANADALERRAIPLNLRFTFQ